MLVISVKRCGQLLSPCSPGIPVQHWPHLWSRCPCLKWGVEEWVEWGAFRCNPTIMFSDVKKEVFRLPKKTSPGPLCGPARGPSPGSRGLSSPVVTGVRAESRLPSG